MPPYLPSLGGGLLIGLSAAMLLLLNGRIAGVSGIVGNVVQGVRAAANAAFVVGLMLGPVLYLAVFDAWPNMTISASWPVIVAAGLLVGFGTRMGSGCTSGHGVVGIARLSPRSITATLVFLTSGVVAVALSRVIAP